MTLKDHGKVNNNKV